MTSEQTAHELAYQRRMAGHWFCRYMNAVASAEAELFAALDADPDDDEDDDDDGVDTPIYSPPPDAVKRKQR